MTSDITHRRRVDPPGNTSDITQAVPRRARHGRAPTVLPAEFENLCHGYAEQLEATPLDPDSRRAYASRLRSFLAWLSVAAVDGDPLADPATRDGAVRDYRTHLQTVAKRTPATINAHLAALADFYTRTGLGVPDARRLDLPHTAPKALNAKDQTRWLRTCERWLDPRDRALGYLPFYAGLRIGEAVALDLDDLRLSARKGTIIVRAGKGGRYREVPAHPVLRENLAIWINDERPGWPSAATEPALLLNRHSGRLTVKGADDILGRIADSAGIDDFTTHVLRHSFATNLVRSGTDLVLVAELMGHARLESTRRYTRPTAADRENAVNNLPTDR
jgi:site-specific recombinase XerD